MLRDTQVQLEQAVVLGPEDNQILPGHMNFLEEFEMRCGVSQPCSVNASFKLFCQLSSTLSASMNLLTLTGLFSCCVCATFNLFLLHCK